MIEIARQIAEPLQVHIRRQIAANEEVIALIYAEIDGSQAIARELRQWRENARNRMKRGLAPKLFASDTLPAEIVDRVWFRLESADSLDGINRAFLPVLANAKVAGLAVKAADTGRVLLIQRAIASDDPASGKWEFPGGHLESETSFDGACREWSEETGCVLPDGEVAGSWLSPNGIYECWVYVIESEDLVPNNPDPENRDILNPDDPDHDNVCVFAWFDPREMRGNPAMRDEMSTTDWDVLEFAGEFQRFNENHDEQGRFASGMSAADTKTASSKLNLAQGRLQNAMDTRGDEREGHLSKAADHVIAAAKLMPTDHPGREHIANFWTHVNSGDLQSAANEVGLANDSLGQVKRYNPNHDEKGEFASGSGNLLGTGKGRGSHTNITNPVTGEPMTKTGVGKLGAQVFQGQPAQDLAEKLGGGKPSYISANENERAALDFRFGSKTGVELKTISSTTTSQKTAMSREQIDRKEASLKELGLKQGVTVLQVLDISNAKVDVYYAKGFVSKSPAGMKHLGTYSIKGALGKITRYNPNHGPGGRFAEGSSKIDKIQGRPIRGGRNVGVDPKARSRIFKQSEKLAAEHPIAHEKINYRIATGHMAETGKIGSSTYAYCDNKGGGRSEIRMNPKYLSQRTMSSVAGPITGLGMDVNGAMDEITGFHPAGTGTLEGIVTHETGHAYANYAVGPPGDQAVWLTDQGISQTDVSRYAGMSTQEFIAESYASYKMSPGSNALADRVGKSLDAEVSSKEAGGPGYNPDSGIGPISMRGGV